MAYRQQGLLPNLLGREMLGSRGPYMPNSYCNAFTCQAKQAGTIKVDPEGDPCPPYSITYNQVCNGCRFLTVGDEMGYVSIVDTSADELPTSLHTDATREPRAKWLAHSNTIFDMAWAKNDSVLYTASGDQHVGVWDTAVGRLLMYAAGHSGSVKAVCPHSSMPDVFASGSRDGGILLWDLRTPSRWSAAKNSMLLAPILRVDIGATPIHQHGIAQGPTSTPGSSKKKGKTARGRGRGVYGTPTVARKGAGTGSCRRSVTALLFLQDELTMVSSSDVDGVVKLWDLRMLTSPQSDITLPQHQQCTPIAATRGRPASGKGRHGRGNKGNSASGGAGCDDDSSVCWLGFTCSSRNSRPTGITSMALSPAGDTLLVSSIDSCHYLYRLSSLDRLPVACLTGHRTDSFCVKSCFSPCGGHVLSGSSDRQAYIWDMSQPEVPPASLSGHGGEVTAVAWCPGDVSQIVTAADDATLRVWSMDRCNSKYVANYQQHNVLTTQVDQLSGFWGRLGLNSGQQAVHSGLGQQMPDAGQPALAARAAKPHQLTEEAMTPAAYVANAADSINKKQTSVRGSICSPSTPQLPFWRGSSAAAEAVHDGFMPPPSYMGDATAVSAAPSSGSMQGAVAIAAIDVPAAATDAANACQTPAGKRCKAPSAGISPLPQLESHAAHSTPHLRQGKLPQQLAAVAAAAALRNTQHRDQATAAATTAKVDKQQCLPTAEVQNSPGKATTSSSHKQQEHQQQQRIHEPGPHDASQAAMKSTQVTPRAADAMATAATAAAATPVAGSQSFVCWMHNLTPSPAGTPAQGAGSPTNLNTNLNITPATIAAAAAAASGPKTAMAGRSGQHGQQGTGSCVGLPTAGTSSKRSDRKDSVKRGGGVELTAPWDLPSPTRRQRQDEQAALEAHRLLRSQLRLQGQLGAAQQQQQQQQYAAGKGVAADVGCCRLLQDEFDVFCDGEDSLPSAAELADTGFAETAGAHNDGAACKQAGATVLAHHGTAQQQQRQQIVHMKHQSLQQHEAGVSIIPCSLPDNAVDAQPEQQYQQQTQSMLQQQLGPHRQLGQAFLHTADRNNEPRMVLLSDSRTPLSDLSKLMPAAECLFGPLSPAPAAAGSLASGADAMLLAANSLVSPAGKATSMKALKLAGGKQNRGCKVFAALLLPHQADGASICQQQVGDMQGQQEVAGYVGSPEQRRRWQQQHMLLSPTRQQWHGTSAGSPARGSAHKLSRFGERKLSPLLGCQGNAQPGVAAAASAPQGKHLLQHCKQRAGSVRDMLPATQGQTQPELVAEQQHLLQHGSLQQQHQACMDIRHDLIADEGCGHARKSDGTAAAAWHVTPGIAASGGIKRSNMSAVSSHKRQCKLADLWAIKQQQEVEDGASRFSGF